MDEEIKQVPTDYTEAGLKEWMEAYPIPIEDFGKDWIGIFHGLLEYKMDHESVIALRQALNTSRKILLNSTHGTLDFLKVTHPWPMWFPVQLSETELEFIRSQDWSGSYHFWQTPVPFDNVIQLGIIDDLERKGVLIKKVGTSRIDSYVILTVIGEKILHIILGTL